MDTTWALWAATLAGIVILLAIDFILAVRKPHEVAFKEAVAWSVFYIGIAVLFGVGLWLMYGADISTQYYSAYLVEKSLSVDNLFVFMIILTQFATPKNLHQRVLLVGVILALVLRGIFILAGAAALEAFTITFAAFGVLLIWTGIALAKHRNEDPDVKDNLVVKTMRRRFRIYEGYQGTKLTTRINGKLTLTYLALVMVAIGTTDVLFALDSIPATFGVTSEAYLVFTANAFALLGLRALYFLLAGLLDKLVYLSTGLAIILVFIGIKLIGTFAHETWPDLVGKMPTTWSLAFIASVLAIVTIASIIKVKRDPSAHAHAGRLTDKEDTP